LGVPLTVEGVAQVKIKSDDVSIRTAAEQLLDKQVPEIIEIARKTLEGHIRGTCATLTIEEINADRAALSSKIQEEAVPDFNKLGIAITVFVIKDIKDRVGYLEALGKKRTAEVKRDAEIGAANAIRDQTIQVAMAQRDGEIGKAEATQRDMVIKVTQATRDGAFERTQREAEISEAEKKRDVLRAGYLAEVKTREAARDLAYDIQASVQKQELIRQQMQVEIEKKKKEVDLQQQTVLMQEKAQQAEQVVPALKQADAMAAIADGEKRKTVTVAEGEAGKIKMIAEAEAYRIRITGEAEASRVLVVGTAEAKAMQLKADSWKQYTDAAKLQMIIDKLPEIANAMAKPLENTQKVVILGSEGTSGMVRMTTDAIAKLPAVVESLTGQKMMDLIGDLADVVRGDKKKGP
jgi:flotillin